MKGKVELYREEAGPWRWRYVSTNGRIVAHGGQGYSRRIDCLKSCTQVLGGWLVLGMNGHPDVIERAIRNGGYQHIEVRGLGHD